MTAGPCRHVAGQRDRLNRVVHRRAADARPADRFAPRARAHAVLRRVRALLAGACRGVVGARRAGVAAAAAPRRAAMRPHRAAPVPGGGRQLLAVRRQLDDR